VFFLLFFLEDVINFYKIKIKNKKEVLFYKRWGLSGEWNWTRFNPRDKSSSYELVKYIKSKMVFFDL
jgi:hypothetical protein